jgi:hypothetical protein
MRYGKTTLIILLIGFLVLMSGCGKKAEEETKIEQKAEIEETETPEPVQEEVVEEVKEVEEKEVIPEKPVDTGAKVFAVQILSLTDLFSVELQQELMLKKGVRTEISEFVQNDETYYRLRLEGRYSRHGAEEVGEQIKRDFWGITDYWIVKTD